MSGGSMNYFSAKLEDAADRFSLNTPARRALREHMLALVEVLYEVEWVDSGDRAPGDDDQMIRETLGEPAIAATLRDELNSLIYEAKDQLERLK